LLFRWLSLARNRQGQQTDEQTEALSPRRLEVLELLATVATKGDRRRPADRQEHNAHLRAPHLYQAQPT
jgi:transposase-like protein